MQEYANEIDENMIRYRDESKEIIERMNKVDFCRNICDGVREEQPNLKVNHDENCTCSYCDPSAPVIMSDPIKDDREVHEIKHGEHCGCQYCRGDRLGTIEPEIVSLNQFSSKEEERKYLEEDAANFTFLKDCPPTDTKSFKEMYSVWKKNLAGDLEKEYTVASKKDLEALAKKDIRVARKINSKGQLKSAAKAAHRAHVEDSWKGQLKAARVPLTRPKTRLVLVYVGCGSQSKWDKIINKCKPIFSELEEIIPQCKTIFIPDVGAQEGQIRVETHDLS